MKVEAEAVAAAEQKYFDKALELFQKSIDLAPHRAAPYNNRAQNHRLMGNEDGMYFPLLQNNNRFFLLRLWKIKGIYLSFILTKYNILCLHQNGR